MIELDRETDALYLRLKPGQAAYSEEIRPGLVVDYAQTGEPLGVEILGASLGVWIPEELRLHAAPRKNEKAG